MIGVIRKRRILIVDDESGLVRLMTVILEKTDRYQVRGETDASAALESALVFQPDLILLDLIMPRIDGRELATRFRANEALRKKPIIFVSATVLKSDGIPAQIAGFPALAKPIAKRELLEVVDAHLPTIPEELEEPQWGWIRHAKALWRKRRRKAAQPEQEDSLKRLIGRLYECVSTQEGASRPTCEAKILTVNEDVRILSLTLSWTYAPARVLHLRIERATPDSPISATVSVNGEIGQRFEETKTNELLARIREQVAILRS